MITSDDVYIDSSRISHIVDRIHSAAYDSWSRNDVISTYGKSPIDLGRIVRRSDQIYDAETAANTAKFVLTAIKHGNKLLADLPKLAVDPSWDKTYRSDGLITRWFDRDIEDWIVVKRSAIQRELADYLQPTPDDAQYIPSDRHIQLFFINEQLSKSFTGNPANGILQRALWTARRARLIADIAGMSNVNIIDSYSNPKSDGVYIPLNLSGARAIPKIISAIESAITAKPSRHEYETYRSIMLSDQADYQRITDAKRIKHAGERFAKYWDSLKSTKVAQSAGDAHLEFAQIPILPSGTASSRTWGIEIETTRAGDTSRPAGWTSEYDGSLPDSDSGECNCDCDDCYNGDHCDDTMYDCHYNDSDAESREFVSPILSHFNSTGLQRICNDLGTDPDERSEPGIHVHVGASDLSVSDISNLLLSYSAIERFFEPLLHRKVRNYCKPTTTDALRWWLAKAREIRRLKPDSIPGVSDVVYEMPHDRYYDVNVQALTKHGTIEFRSMGAWYDYDHLVRWAWIVRELVNVSKLGIDQREWTSCNGIADVVALLRKYGSEMPDNSLIEEAFSGKEMQLTATQQ